MNRHIVWVGIVWVACLFFGISSFASEKALEEMLAMAALVKASTANQPVVEDPALTG